MMSAAFRVDSLWNGRMNAARRSRSQESVATSLTPL